MARQIRSVTVPHDQQPPPWARYLVMVCSSDWHAPHPSQAFAARTDAEKWSRAVAKSQPSTATCDGPKCWTLVYALGADRSGRPYFGGGICYLAFNGGGECVKSHTIPVGYGVRAAA